jgi:hypothetical protein
MFGPSQNDKIFKSHKNALKLYYEFDLTGRLTRWQDDEYPIKGLIELLRKVEIKWIHIISKMKRQIQGLKSRSNASKFRVASLTLISKLKSIENRKDKITKARKKVQSELDSPWSVHAIGF